MKCEWDVSEHRFTHTVLVADIGGTNANFGLAGYDNNTFNIIARGWCSSSDIEDFAEPVIEFIKLLETDSRFISPVSCCIAAAGPVSGNRCSLTNCTWDIDGNELEKRLAIPVAVTNDFLAVSHGIPLLDHRNPNSIVSLPHCDGYRGNDSDSGVKLVIGPGTGLGVSYIVPHKGEHLPFPSEGGHSDFAAFDEETAQLKSYVTRNTLVKPGIEPFLSGPGLVNIFNFLTHTRNFPMDEYYSRIINSPEEIRPELISKGSSKSLICRETMRIFARILGHVAGSFSAIFLPEGGVYIAGGIAAKNLNSFILPG